MHACRVMFMTDKICLSKSSFPHTHLKYFIGVLWYL